MNAYVVGKETYCWECVVQINKVKWYWTCDDQCIQLCRGCIQKRIDKEQKENDELDKWAKQTKKALNDAKEVPTKVKQQCYFDVKMAKQEPRKCIKRCANWASCRESDCANLHQYTNPRIIALKVPMKCGCPGHVPMPGMDGYTESEKQAIRKAECPMCAARIICPYYAAKGTCPFEGRCLGIHEEDKQEGEEMDMDQWCSSCITTRHQREAIPAEIDFRHEREMSEGDWGAVRAYHTKVVEKVQLAVEYRRQLRDIKRKGGNGCTNIRPAQRSPTKA